MLLPSLESKNGKKSEKVGEGRAFVCSEQQAIDTVTLWDAWERLSLTAGRPETICQDSPRPRGTGVARKCWDSHLHQSLHLALCPRCVCWAFLRKQKHEIMRFLENKAGNDI